MENRRLTVVSKIYLQTTQEEPFAVDVRYEEQVLSDEQVWERHTKVGEGWIPLDCGWVDEASLVVITNNEMPVPHNQLTGSVGPVNVHILEVGESQSRIPIFEIPPGQSLPGRPVDLKGLVIRSRGGTVRFTVWVLPA